MAGNAWSESEVSMEEGRPHRRSSCCSYPGLEDALASLGPKDGVSELNDAVNDLSRWSAFREAAKYLAWGLELRRLINIFVEYKAKVVVAEDPMEKIAWMFKLEQELSAASGLSERILGMFACALEAFLLAETSGWTTRAFQVPSKKALKEFQEDIDKLWKSTLGTPFKVQDWADCQVKPDTMRERLRDAGASEDELNMVFSETEQKKFARQLSVEWARIREAFCSKFVRITDAEGDTKNPLYYCAFGVSFNCFNEALDAHSNYRWLSTQVGGGTMCRVYDRRKEVLCWTQLGYSATQLVQRKMLATALETPLSSVSKYSQIGTVVIPNFIQQLTMLTATIDAKVSEVEFMKTKVIAAGVSLFITGAPVVVKLIYRATGFEEDGAR